MTRINQNHIRIPSHSGTRVVPSEQIVRIESLDNYSKIYFTHGQPLVVSKLLLWFESRLPMNMFARVHRSHLVNKIHVMGVNRKAGSASLLLKSGENIHVSRRKRSLLFPLEWEIKSLKDCA